MVTINVLDHVEHCYSNQDGAIIKSIIIRALSNNECVTISFRGVDGVTSSFVNTALIELLDNFDFDLIKANVKFVNSSKQINNMIRSRFRFEVNRRKNLVKVLA